jgi:cytochrome c-type biogenesis protein CcmH/NrfG
VRVAGVVLALVVCAWFALGIRQVTSREDARALAARAERPSPRVAARERGLLDRAAQLNPDREIDLLRAGLALGQDDRPAAVRTLERVVREEPQNIQGWTQLAFTTGRTDPATFSRAAQAIRRLSPRVPAP